MGTNLIRHRVYFVHRDRQPEPKSQRIENKVNHFDHANIDLKHLIFFYQTISFATRSGVLIRRSRHTNGGERTSITFILAHKKAGSRHTADRNTKSHIISRLEQSETPP